MKGKLYIAPKLSEEQQKMVREAEQTLHPGKIEIVVYRPVEADIVDLNPSQIECLQGLEQKLGGLTAVAIKA